MLREGFAITGTQQVSTCSVSRDLRVALSCPDGKV